MAGRMLSIWFFVSLVLATYGVVILAVGIARTVSPPQTPDTALAHLNPSLWWGAVMILAAALLFLADRLGRRKQG